MNTESTTSNSDNESRPSVPADALSGASENEKQTISPAERWLLVREKAYARAQKRGFMGGNPFEDWRYAEQDIDSRYMTDSSGMMSLADPREIAKQIKKLLAGRGLGHLSVDALLQKHTEGMHKLAVINRTVFDSASELAKMQTSLAQDSLAEAVKTLTSVAKGEGSANGMAKQAEFSVKAVENAMSHLRILAAAMTGMPPGEKKEK